MLLDKKDLSIAGVILYGLSMGTISMVLYQRMYMLLSLFVMLYFYYSLKIYKNNFEIDKKMIIQLGIITVLGFLTQYLFAIYAVLIFIMMIIKMIRDKKYNCIKKYFICHFIYGVIGVLLFVPCISHILFSSRGITNIKESSYILNLKKFFKYLAFSFSVNSNIKIFLIVLFFVGILYLYKKSNQKFLVVLSTLPSILYFFIIVKISDFQELRYIMPVIFFVSMFTILIFDKIIKFKYKSIIVTAISIIIVSIGIICSEPKFLYKNYKDIIKIAEENSDKSFVYVYNNFFNHIQSIPEMMIYNKTLIINNKKDEVNYILIDETLNSEDSYILCIKSYMNNKKILDKIKNNTDFKNIKELYKITEKASDEYVRNNYYLVSK